MYNSFIYALNGLRTVLREEKNFRIEIGIALLVTIAMFVFQFAPGEMLFCFLAIGMVLTSEIINTVIEDLCDKVQPEHDLTIGKIKDMMAAYVLLSCISAVIIGIVIFKFHFFP